MDPTTNEAITLVHVQICDMYPKQPFDLVCEKKVEIDVFLFLFFNTKEVNGLFGVDVTDLNRSTGNGCVHRSSRCLD